MTLMTLIGIDPGQQDTGVVALRFDTKEKTWSIQSQVWTEVPRRDGTNKRVIDLSTEYKVGLPLFVKYEEGRQPTFIGIEGYRQRGNNVTQDQNMLYMVQATNKLLPGSTIVDNTGIRNVVTREMLKLFKVHRFPDGDNHADRVSAARVALKLGISIDVLNEVLYQFIVDMVEGEPWSLV